MITVKHFRFHDPKAGECKENEQTGKGYRPKKGLFDAEVLIGLWQSIQFVRLGFH